MKRIITLLFAFVLLIPGLKAEAVAYDASMSHETLAVRFWDDAPPPIGFYINASSRYILETVTAPRMGSTYGEWSVMDLLRGMYTGYDYINYIPNNYFEDYVGRINSYVLAKEGELDRNKSTEWSRLTLSLSALGKDIRAVGTPGDYIKAITAKQEKDKWVIESSSIGSVSSIKLSNNQLKVDVPVGVQKADYTYELLTPGTYNVTQTKDALTLTKDGQVTTLAPTEYVQLTKPYNFVERMSKSHRFSYRQGINGPIWVIIAMNTGQYELVDEAALQANGIQVAENDVNTVGKMIDYILQREITTTAGELGGWALTGNKPDPDITGMALQAFAPYYVDEKKFNTTQSTFSYREFQAAVERGVMTMKRMQLPNGGYESWGSVNAESIVQVIVALTAMGMDPLQDIHLPTINETVSFITEGAFVDGVWTNNMIDALLSFFAPNSGSSPKVGGFKHVTAGYDGGGGAGTTVNAMATDQALYGLIAYDRFLKGENSLYDMTDMIDGQYQTMQPKTYTITFVDGEKQTTHVSPYALVKLPDTAKAWNSAQDFHGTRYLAGEKLVMPEHNITLYAEHNPSDDNTAATNKVIDMIDALPDIQTISKEYKNQIDRIQTAYQKLSKTAQQQVSNYPLFLELAAKVNGQLAQYDDALKIDNLMQTITSLQRVPVISRDYEIAITNARVAYNNLTAQQRMLITNRQVLDELEAALALSIDVEQGTQLTVAAVQTMIDALPKDNVQLGHAAMIFKTNAAIQQLTAQQQSTLNNSAVVQTLIEQIRTLQDEQLQTEQFEDALADDSYGKLTVIGQTLHVTAPRTTGTFQVRIHTDTLHQAITDQVQRVIFSDVRGVQLTIDKQTLLKQLEGKTGELILHVGQLNFDTQQFSVQWRLSTGDTLISPSYMQLTIPYAYFVNGRNLAEKQLVKIAQQAVATSHRSTEHHVTIHLFAGATYQFVQHDLQFSDVKKEQAEDLLYLANRLVVNGRADGTYGPNDSITRGQFAGMVNRALGLEPKKVTAFTDIKGQWYEQDVQALFEAGIIKGTSATTFNPSGKLTRQQAAVMMGRILQFVDYPLAELTQGTAYADQARISKEAQPIVFALKNLGIMSGSQNTFKPTDALTRLQMAKILKRTLAVAQLL